jgi:hypothetical protein
MNAGCISFGLPMYLNVSMLTPLLLSPLILCATAGAYDKKPAAHLANEWHGTWKGTLTITNQTDKQSEVPLVFNIEPIKGTHDVRWAMTYGEGDKAVVKDYKLVPVPEQPGRFRIDEGNAVALNARLVNGVIFSQFDVGGYLLTARYELRGETLRFEVSSSKPAAKKTGGNFQGYVVEVVQSAELRKKGPSFRRAR